MIDKLSSEARTFLSDFLNQIDYEKDQIIKEKDVEIERLYNLVNIILRRIAILEREVEKYEGF